MPTDFAAAWFLSTSPRHESRNEAAGVPSEHGRVRTLADMSPEEVKALEAKYGAPVRPSAARRAAARSRR